MNENYQNLANGIVIQAVKDYRDALFFLENYRITCESDKKNTEYIKMISVKKEIERFVHSDWYKALTNIDGDKLLKKLQSEVV